MDPADRGKRAAEEAAEWWVVLQNEAPRAERERYVDWLRESSLHVAEMLRVAEVHGAVARFERWANLPAEDSGQVSGEVVQLSLPGRDTAAERLPATRRTLRLTWTIAATLILAAGAGIWFLVESPGQIIETQRGERREVSLADGSVLQVDPETRLRVDYERNARRVYLERGRALFHVAKNAARPFLVRADDTTIRAVGTAFAVEQSPNSVVVTVAEGRVAVVSAPLASAPSNSRQQLARSSSQPVPVSPATVKNSQAAESNPGSPESPDEIYLTANEQVTVAGSGTAEPVHEVDSKRALAWAEGRLIFENETVERAVEQFNRYNRVQLTVTDGALARRTISGVFSASDPESFVAFMRTVAPHSAALGIEATK